MIFLRYENFREYLRYYPVTSAILALNLLVFLADLALDGRLFAAGAFFQHPVIDRYGLSEPWRYVTSIFLHADWEHLLFNAFAILVFAPPLERLIGHFRYAVFYLLAGILANAYSAAVHVGAGDRISVGASGAVYGVFGAYLYLALFRKRWMDEGSRRTVYAILLFGLLYSVIYPRIDIWAHVGGCLAGFLMLGMLAQGRNR
jgi:membrane associated rhomboid family serine protease